MCEREIESTYNELITYAKLPNINTKEPILIRRAPKMEMLPANDKKSNLTTGRKFAKRRGRKTRKIRRTDIFAISALAIHCTTLLAMASSTTTKSSQFQRSL